MYSLSVQCGWLNMSEQLFSKLLLENTYICQQRHKELWRKHTNKSNRDCYRTAKESIWNTDIKYWQEGVLVFSSGFKVSKGKIIFYMISGINYIECVLRKFADHNKLSGAVTIVKRRDAIQSDLDMLDNRPHMILIRFNKAYKCERDQLILSDSDRTGSNVFNLKRGNVD